MCAIKSWCIVHHFWPEGHELDCCLLAHIMRGDNSLLLCYLMFNKTVVYAHKKHEEGLTVNEIALLLHSSTKTVQKYLKLEPSEIVDRIIIKEKHHLFALQQKQQEVEHD